MPTTPLNPNNPGTPNNDFIHGVKGSFYYQLGGMTAPTRFDIEQVSGDFAVETDDITNTSSGGARVVLDGIEEVTGSVSFVFDSLAVPTVAPQPFKPRTYATLLIKPDGVTVYQFAALITRFGFSTGPKAGTVRVTADYRSTGPITFPTASLTTPTVPLTGS
jgi:hypothetical protein